ncbi:MAG: nucleoside hydrolase [Halanaerobium sp.]
MTEKKKVIIDCDPGHDDAIGLLLAAASRRLNYPYQLEILGITIAAGNQTLAKTVNNALKILEFAEIEADVYPGYAEPLIRKLEIAPQVHGETGLDGPKFEIPSRRPKDKHAVTFMIDTLRAASEKITIITTGPMTNLAAAMIGAPDIIDKIEEVVFMGGSAYRGNWTAAAEFNILVDPEAAQFVIKSDLKKKMVGLEVTRKAMFYPEDITKMKNEGNRVAKMAGELLEYFVQFHINEKKMPGCPLHDPLAVASVIYPDLLKTESYSVNIECGGQYTTGRTVVDFDRDKFITPPTDVALEVDVEAFKELLFTALKSY